MLGKELKRYHHLIKENHLSKEWIYRSIAVLFIAIAAEFLCHFEFYSALNAGRMDQERKVFEIDDVSYVNLSCDGRIVNNGIDPQIYLKGIDGYVSNVAVRLDDISIDVIPIQIYYSVNDEYDDEKCNTIDFTEKDKVKFISISQNTKDLRVDIGSSKNELYKFREVVVNPNIGDYLLAGFWQVSWTKVIIYFICFLICLLFVFGDQKIFINNLFQNRWQIGGGSILIATIMKIHGSSIGIIEKAVSGYNVSELWGIDRGIRSDEFLVSTGLALSQYYTKYAKFSDLWGYSPRDVSLLGAVPVFDITFLYHPFNWGYFFLGPERGLAFFWSARFVILLLVSFEFCRIITKDNRMLSFVYSVLVVLSPFVQWWYATGLLEILIYGQAAVILLDIYIRTNRISYKILIMAGLVICAAGYILVLYPAWMIPFFYVFLACAISVLMENYKNIKIKIEDIVFWSLAIMVLSITIGYHFWNSRETIQTIMGTIYPGKRIYEGGPLDNLPLLFRGWTSFLWSFVETENPCEKVGFVNYYPIGLILSIIVLRRKKDCCLWCLNVIGVALTLYLLLNMPAFVAKMTLLSSSQGIRLVDAISYINLIILIKALSLISKEERACNIGILIPCATLFAIIGLWLVRDTLTPMLRILVVIVAFLFGYTIINYIKDRKCKSFFYYNIVLCIVGGFLVNPINRGLGCVYDMKLVKEIQRINKNGDIWVNEGSILLNSLPAEVGAKSLNAVALYPDDLLWDKIDLKQQENEWNRYAHILINLSDKKSLTLLQPDLVELDLKLKDFRVLGVNYLISAQDYSKEKGLKKISGAGGYSIYRIKKRVK